MITSSAVLGGLGGAVSAFDAEDAWGSSPRNPDGSVCAIVAYATFAILQESITEAAVKGNLREFDTMSIFRT